MSVFPKLGPLIDEKGLGWLFPSETAIPAPIQNQVADWFWYRRLSDADENKFLRFFQRKVRATEGRFLALMSAQATEIDPLVQELFEASVEATRNGKTVTVGNRTSTNTGKTSSNGSNSSNGSTDGTTSGTSSATSKSTTSAQGTTSNENESTVDGTSSSNLTHNSQNSNAQTAYPESALTTPGPIQLPDEITLTHLASLTVDKNQSTDGTLGTNKSTNKDKGSGTTSSSGESSGETSGESSGTSHSESKSSGTSEMESTSTGSETSETNNTVTDDGGNTSKSSNKGRHMSAQELLSKYLDFIYRCDAILWFVNELEPCFMSVYDDSGVDCFVWEEDAAKDGKDGVTFIPHTQVLSDGVRIYWTNDGGLPNPDPVEVMNGKMGPAGPKGEDGSEGPAGDNGATFTPIITEIEGGYTLSWENDKGYPNPQSVNILNGVGGDMETGPANTFYGGTGDGNIFGEFHVNEAFQPLRIVWTYNHKLLTAQKVYIDGNALVTDTSTFSLGNPEKDTVEINGEQYYVYHPTVTLFGDCMLNFSIRKNTETSTESYYLRIGSGLTFFDPIIGVYARMRSFANFDIYVRTDMILTPSRFYQRAVGVKSYQTSNINLSVSNTATQSDVGMDPNFDESAVNENEDN